MSQYTGGCACGVIRYESLSVPKASFYCQCRQCQRATGSGHAALLIFKSSDVSVKGNVKYYDQLADDGNNISRGFCPHCGSPVLGKTSAHSDVILIHAASLDDPGVFKPEKVMWSAVKQPWDYIDPKLPAR